MVSGASSLLLLAWLVIGSSLRTSLSRRYLITRLVMDGVCLSAVLLVACLWDRYAKYRCRSLRSWLLACAIVLQQLELSRSTSCVGHDLFGCVQIATALLWHWRGRLIGLAKSFGIRKASLPK